jgi:hypothetical protein
LNELIISDYSAHRAIAGTLHINHQSQDEALFIDDTMSMPEQAA